MSGIHQIYCTHCTHGSSALERREGELAHRMLGYSARAGSVDAAELRRYYRQIDRYTYYYLPRDTPGEEKLRLTAATAPRRLIYLPSIGGLQIVGQVVYRQMDTEGRPGSYFAHVLFRDEQQQKTPWPVLDCLKLWAAPGWVCEDSPAIPFLLRPLQSLDEIRAGQPFAVDDRMLLSFLTVPAGGEFHDPRGVLPPRWRQQEPAARREMFIAAMAGLLEVAGQRNASLLLVIEPSMAALVYYGLLRLLPDCALRNSISFSTFEPNADRLCTTLAATWFYDPARADPRIDASRTRGIVLNTLTGVNQRPGEAVFAKRIVDCLTGKGWPAVDRMLANMQAAGAKTAEDFERLAAMDGMAGDLLGGRAVAADPQWRQSPAAVGYLRRTLAEEIAALPDPATTLAPLIGSSSHVLILELLAGEQEMPGVRPAVEFLLAHLPDRMIAEVVRLDAVAAEHKIDVLAECVAIEGRLPPGCEHVWEQRDAASAGEWLLPEILARLDLPAIEKLYDTAAQEHSAGMVAALVEARNRTGCGAAALTRIVEAVDVGTLLTLHRRHGAAFFERYPADEPAMTKRLDEVLRTLPDHAEQFSQRLDVLLAGEQHLPSDQAVQMLGDWNRVRRAILDIGELQGQASGLLRRRPLLPLESACRRMAEAAAQALPAKVFEDDLIGTRKQECLRRIGRSLLGGQRLLPGGRRENAALWQKVAWFFQSGQWPKASLSKMRLKNRPQLRAWLALVAVACCIVMLAILWKLASQRGPALRTPSEAESRASLPHDTDVQRAADEKAAREKAEQLRARQRKAAEAAAAQRAAEQRQAEEKAKNAAEEMPEQPVQEKEAQQPRAESPHPETEVHQPKPVQGTVKPPEQPPAKEPVTPTEEPAPANSPLKKGTGSEPTSKNPAKDDGREVPVPLFQRAAKGGDAPEPSPRAAPPSTAGIPQLSTEWRVDVAESSYRPTYAEIAKLMVQVIPVRGQGWPKWFNDEVIVMCAVCEYPEEGDVRTRDLTAATKPKAHLVIAGTTRAAVRVEFFRRDAAGAVRLIAETPWHELDKIQRGAEYRVKAVVTAEVLEKLRPLTANK